MNDYNFGDIILVPFPFTNQTASKQRPSVVISSRDYNQERPDLIVMAITSQIKTQMTLGEMAIVEWENAGLLKPSVIKPVIATIEQTLVRKRLGQLGETGQVSLHSALGTIID